MSQLSSSKSCGGGIFLLGNPLVQDQDQINAAFQCLRNDLYASTYNPVCRNHPNFFWNQGTYQGDLTSNLNHPSGSQFSRANRGSYQTQNSNSFVDSSSSNPFHHKSIIPTIRFQQRSREKVQHSRERFRSFDQIFHSNNF